MTLPETPTPPVQELGAPTSEFSLPGIHGGTLTLSDVLGSDVLGSDVEARKGAVVIFWSGVCSHCIRYDSYLNAFTETHPQLGLAVVASRAGETPEQIRQTMADRGIRFPILHDAGGLMARQWFTQQTPRAFLLDADRTLLYRGAIDNFKYPGDPDYTPHLEVAIADFLAGRPIQRAETASFGCAIQSVYYNLPKHL